MPAAPGLHLAWFRNQDGCTIATRLFLMGPHGLNKDVTVQASGEQRREIVNSA